VTARSLARPLAVGALVATATSVAFSVAGRLQPDGGLALLSSSIVAYWIANLLVGASLAEPARARRDPWWGLVVLALALPLVPATLSFGAFPGEDPSLRLLDLGAVAGILLALWRSARASQEPIPPLALGLGAAYAAMVLTLALVPPASRTFFGVARYGAAVAILRLAAAFLLFAATPARGPAAGVARRAGLAVSLAGIALDGALYAALPALDAASRPLVVGVLVAEAVATGLFSAGLAIIALARGLETEEPAPAPEASFAPRWPAPGSRP